MVVEALIEHVLVDLRAGVAFAKPQAVDVDAQGLLDELFEFLVACRLRARSDRVGRVVRVVGGVQTIDCVLQDIDAVGRLFCVFCEKILKFYLKCMLRSDC